MSKRYLWLFFTVTTLIMSGIFITTQPAHAQNPSIFIDPSEIVGDLTPAPGSLTQLKVNVSNIGTPGMIGHEFYLALDPEAFSEYEPLTNQNFTTDASGWTAIPTVTRGTPTYGYYATDGNPSPGSGPGCYRMRANATGTLTASITYLLEQSFTWNVGAPPDQGALLSFAYTISGNSFGTVSVGIRVIKPDGTTISTLITTRTYNTAKAWSYNFTAAPSGAFNQLGTYKFQLRSALTTSGTATTNYVEIRWDDVGLILAPVSATEGSFFTTDPRNVGKTYWTSKYLKFPTNVSLYVADSLTGIPWTDVYPVQGSGTIANVKLLTNYGWTNLDLWGTMLTQPTLVPPYPPEQISHDTLDGYFDNRITGDSDGNGVVSISDMGEVSDRWTSPPGVKPYARFVDWDNSGTITISDMGIVSDNWGRHYP